MSIRTMTIAGALVAGLSGQAHGAEFGNDGLSDILKGTENRANIVLQSIVPNGKIRGLQLQIKGNCSSLLKGVVVECELRAGRISGIQGVGPTIYSPPVASNTADNYNFRGGIGKGVQFVITLK